MEIKHIEFKELRLAYSTVKQFIKRESPKGVKQLDNKLVEDLRLQVVTMINSCTNSLQNLNLAPMVSIINCIFTRRRSSMIRVLLF